jgi:ATP:cob(I)alamin adenosyltransferase
VAPPAPSQEQWERERQNYERAVQAYEARERLDGYAWGHENKISDKRYCRATESRTAAFEQVMDDAETELPPLRAFVLPAGTPKAAALHLARTVCRRAERSVIHLSHDAEVPELFIVYLNRLSDLLFTLARLANHRAGSGDVVW